MASMEVCSIIGSILAAFNSGMGIFKQMKSKQKFRKRKTSVEAQGELQLQDSLQRRPEEIRAEYTRSVVKLGHRFEIGDTLAHTSLAHTLLVLNTGLVNVINNAMSDDMKKRQLSKRSLLNLSEVAAADALHALGQLNVRLTASSQLALTSRHHMKQEKERTQTSKKAIFSSGKETTNPQKSKKRPGPAPLLIRGGWVRPRSGSSDTSTASASKVDITSPMLHRRSKSTPVSTEIKSESSAKSSPQSPQVEHEKPKGHQSSTSLPSDIAQEHHRRHHRTSSGSRPHREPSMLLVPSDLFSAQYLPQVDEQTATVSAPPIPPKIPLHSRPDTRPTPTSLRPRPPSVATFMTASTKIGEIPEHLWPDRNATVEEGHEERPLPYVVPPPLDPDFGNGKKNRSRGFRFWKRNDREAETRRDFLVY